jgi:hypothetical protein
MSTLRDVVVTVSGQKTADIYYSRSYPNEIHDEDGKVKLYATPVYKVFIKGKNAAGGEAVTKEWTALRFMPYWNDPKRRDPRYKTIGWVNSGKYKVPRKAVTYYNPTYGTHNRYSPFSGAIQIDGSFLIHAGPNSLSESGWGAAGCVEIIGNFDDFKNDIRDLSGSSAAEASAAILELVHHHHLFVEVQYALPPNLRAYEPTLQQR